MFILNNFNFGELQTDYILLSTLERSFILSIDSKIVEINTDIGF